MPFKESNFEELPKRELAKKGEERKIGVEETEKISKEEIEEIEKAELERTRKELKEIMGEGPKEKKEKGMVKRLKKLTAKIEQAIIERMLTNPDSLAEDKDFDNLHQRLVSEAEILAKRYKINDEIDERGNIIKEGYEKILEVIGYNYNPEKPEKKYQGVRKGDLMNYERNALFRMWNLPAEKNDIERFENKINREAEKLAASKKFQKYGITKEKILNTIDFGETEEAIKSPEGISKEDLLSWQGGFLMAINDLRVDKKGEIIKSFGARFLESPKSKWAKKAFVVGVPTLLFFSLYVNAPKPGKEKPVSLEQLEENPDLMDKVYKEAIFKAFCSQDWGAAVGLDSEFGLVRADLTYHYDRPYINFIPIPTPLVKGPGVPEMEKKYFEEMKKIGLHLNKKDTEIPLDFYLEHQNEINKIINETFYVEPKEFKEMDNLEELIKIINESAHTPILSWENFSIGEDTSEKIEKINSLKKNFEKCNTYTIPSSFTSFNSQEPEFRKGIEKLFEKEGYNETKLKEIAKENPKEVIEIVAKVISKNIKPDKELLAEVIRAKKEGRRIPITSLSKILEEEKGICDDTSRLFSATVDYMQSKEILPKNLLVEVIGSDFMFHKFNSVLTVDHSGRLVSTYIDVDWFEPEKIAIAPEAYDLSAVDYYHKLGLDKEQIKEIMTARFSEYVQLTKDISTYDPWLHKRQREIIVEP